MNLLLLGTFNEGSIEHYFSEGFRLNGINVIHFDITKEYYTQIERNIFTRILNRVNPDLYCTHINQSVKDFCFSQKPDVIFVLKGLTLFPETLEEIKQFCKLLVNYNPDHPLVFYSRGSGNLNIKNSISKYDIFFSYSRNICSKVSKECNVDSYWIPFGYNPNFDKLELKTNLLFDNFLFFGAYDKFRLNFLNNLNRDDIEIYGDAIWGEKLKHFAPSIQKSFKNKKLYNKDLISKTNTCLATINILREQNIVEKSHNMRTFEVPGMGGTLISNYTEEQAYFFEPNKEMLYFNSSDELIDKLNFLKKNPNFSLKMKENALIRSRKSRYSYFYRCKEMLEIISKKIKQ